MPYYKGTLSECESYNQDVILGENYHPGTTNWADISHIGSNYYILKAEPPVASKSYTSTTMEEVAELPTS